MQEDGRDCPVLVTATSATDENGAISYQKQTNQRNTWHLRKNAFKAATSRDRKDAGEKDRQEQMPEQEQTYRRQHRSRNTSEGMEKPTQEQVQPLKWTTAHRKTHARAGTTP